MLYASKHVYDCIHIVYKYMQNKSFYVSIIKMCFVIYKIKVFLCVYSKVFDVCCVYFVDIQCERVWPRSVVQHD